MGQQHRSQRMRTHRNNPSSMRTFKYFTFHCWEACKYTLLLRLLLCIVLFFDCSFVIMAAPNSYVQDGSGTYIPATQRPDGSWRKARRVKDGYIPQDEMPLYESKGKQWAKSRPTLPVGLDPSYAIPANNTKSSTKTIPGLSLTNSETTAVPKSSKKKKKKKSDSPKVDDVTDEVGKINISTSTKSSTVSENSSQKSQPVTTDPAKRLRNLKKKIRDINTLKQKIESGELPNPDKDQLEKIARKEAIEAEIDDLELELEMA